MNNRIDQLFKDKLGDHRVAPPAEAWLKVEAGVTKKNSYRIVWRAAAVFVLVGLFSAIGIQINRQLQKAEQLSIETNTQNAVTPEHEVIPEHVEPAIALPQANEQSGAVTTLKKKHIKVNDPVAVIEQEQPPQLQDVLENTELTVAQLEVPESVLEPAKEKPVVIEFTLDPLPTRTETLAKDDPDKDSGIMKILDKALDIKNGESDFGSLRNAKNELFALDFRKEKQKRN